METKNATDKQNRLEIGKTFISFIKSESPKKDSIVTSMILFLAGFLMFFLLVLGSLTNNKFGTHLVFNSDLVSSPVWFVSIISGIFAILTIVSIGLFVLTSLNKFFLNEDQNKTIRISSYLIIGVSAFALAISSLCFAAFQTEFFNSQLHDGHTFNSVGNVGFHTKGFVNIGILGGVKVSNQGLIISSILIAILLVIIIGGENLILLNTKVNNKLYYTMRNVSFGLIALGWVGFNLNLVAFGTFGGDGAVLFEGVVTSATGIELTDVATKLDELDVTVNDAIVLISTTEVETFWDLLYNNGIIGQLVVDNVIDSKFNNAYADLSKPQQLTIAGTWSAASIFITAKLSVIDNGLQSLSSALSSLPKDGLMGVNNSPLAYMTFGSFMGLLILLGGYGVAIYVNEPKSKYESKKNNKDSIMFNFSVFVLVGVSLQFAINAFIIPYTNTDMPSLIAGAKEVGGFPIVAVYYTPNYNGTLAWEITFGFLIGIVVASIGLGIFVEEFKKAKRQKIDGDTKEKSSKKEKIEETKDSKEEKTSDKAEEKISKSEKEKIEKLELLNEKINDLEKSKFISMKTINNISTELNEILRQ